MMYRKLGALPIEVSVITVGTWQLAGPVDVDGKPDGYPDVGRQQAIDLIHACQDLGINSIDTAEIYGDGEGERRVGAALAGRRDRWVVTTKFGMRRGPNGARVADASPPTIRPSLEGSLRRLNTDHVDVYLYHCPPAPDAILEGRDVLEALKREGKLRAYGISTYDHEVLARQVGRGAAEVAMFPQSLRRHPVQMLALARTHRLGVLAHGALERGLLSGRYFNSAPQFSAQDYRHGHWFPARQYAIFDRLRPPGLSMAAFALRYVLDLDTTSTVVLGGKARADYEDAVAAVAAPPLGRGRQLLLEGLRQGFALEGKARHLLRPAVGRLRRALAR